MQIGPLKALSAIFVAGVSSQAWAAERFDLVCTGTNQSGINGAHEPWSGRLHIDLVSMAFCVDDCAVVRDIQEATASKITITDTAMATEYIDRSTGQYVKNMDVALGTVLVHRETIGNCEAAPFQSIRRKF